MSLIETIDNLPAIRSTRHKREQSVIPQILNWFLHNVSYSVAIEIKATSARSIAVSALLPHQKRALLDAEGPGIVHKIADTGRRLPFDAFVLKNTPAYVVACFTAYSVAYAIPVSQWDGVRIKKNGNIITKKGQWSGLVPSKHNTLRIPLRS